MPKLDYQTLIKSYAFDIDKLGNADPVQILKQRHERL